MNRILIPKNVHAVGCFNNLAGNFALAETGNVVMCTGPAVRTFQCSAVILCGDFEAELDFAVFNVCEF